MKPAVSAIFGAPGTIKTSIILTMTDTLDLKGKLHLYDFDLGFDRAWQSELKVASGEIIHEPMFLPTRNLSRKETKLEGFLELWQEFVNNFRQDCDSREVSAIAWDTATAVWALCRDAYLQELQRTNVNRKQLLQIEYGEPNQRMNQLFALAKATKTHLLLAHHETDEYVTVTMGGKPVLDQDGNPKTTTSGKKLPDGFRYTSGKADWVFYTYINEETGSPMCRVEKSAEGWQLKGTVWEWFNFPLLEKAVEMYRGISAAPVQETINV
jgi:hypothetical protein